MKSTLIFLKHKRTTLVFLIISILFLFNPAKAQDSPDCCAWIFSTGRFMGWSDALLEYTRPRENPSELDLIIYQQLQEASNSLERAAISCEPFIPAWPGWRQKQSVLANYISELQQPVNHNFKRGRVYNNVNSTYFMWANELSVMTINDETINRITCATCYFQLGFSTAYTAQALRQAKEAITLNNNEKEARRQIQLAVQFMDRSLSVLKTYDDIQQPQGSFVIRCSDIKSLDIPSRIENLKRLTTNLNLMDQNIISANAISDELQNAIRIDCSFNYNFNDENSEGNNENLNNNPNNTYQYCRSKYCPECDNSIVLLGVATGEDCQDCLEKNKDLIFQCMNGNSNRMENTNENSDQEPLPVYGDDNSTEPFALAGSTPENPDCANDPRAVSVSDPNTGMVVCDCIDEYFFWDPVQKKCVRDIQQILASADCSTWPNTEAKWDYELNEPYCDCADGFVWNNNFSACISEIDKLIAETDCSQYLNAQAVWDPVSNEIICDCLPGFRWDENFTRCISEHEAILQTTDCSGFPNTEPVWDFSSQQAYCDCIQGYEWNNDYTACVQIQQQQTQPFQIDCTQYPNSHPAFDPGTNQYFCECDPGFQWDYNTFSCQPIQRKPSIDWGLLMQMTATFLNSNGASLFDNYQSTNPGGINSGNQQPVVHQSRCNDQQQAGANTPEVHNIDLGQSFGSFVFDYQTFNAKDEIIITNGGVTIFNTGCVGEQNSVRLNLSGYSSIISVRVNPNCDGGSSTQWNFTVHCPQY